MKRKRELSQDETESSKRAKTAEDEQDDAVMEDAPAAVPYEQFPALHDHFNMVMFRYLTDRELQNFSNTCRQARDWANDAIQRRQAPKLLTFVVQGNETKTQSLLKICPSLLFREAIATDYSRRHIQETPFKAALREGDVEMCEMMKEYFKKLDGGQTELETQFKEVFPEGVEAHVKTQQESIFNFDDILQAIIRASPVEVITALMKQFDNNSPLHRALYTFRQAFTQKSLSERVFNPYHLLRAFEMYDAQFSNLDSWGKSNLFWHQVIGYVQRYLPDCYAQAFVPWIRGYYENKEQYCRMLFRSRPAYLLGQSVPLNVDFAGWRLSFRPRPGRYPLYSGRTRMGRGDCASFFSEIISKKNISTGKITQSSSALQPRPAGR